MTPERLLAKSQKKNEPWRNSMWLPVHLADVHAAAVQVLDATGNDQLRALDLPVEQYRERMWRIVSLAAAAHDLGKACRAFQLHPQAKELSGKYDGLGPGLPGLRASDAPHGTVTAIALPQALGQHGVEPEVAQLLATVVGGHHGAFPRLPERQAKTTCLPWGSGMF